MKNINKMLNDMKKELTQLQKERDSISEFEKAMAEYRKNSLRSQELNKPELYNTVKAKWQVDYIDYKGRFLDVIKDHVTGVRYTDSASPKYESIIFEGTKKQLHDMLKPLELGPHNDVKIIGSHFVEDIVKGAYGEDINHDEVMRDYEDYLKSKE